MIIKMLTTIAGPKFSASAGEKIDLPEKYCVELVDSGYAAYCNDSKVDPAISEIDEVKGKLDVLGIKYHPNSKLETLKKKLNKASEA